jgi:hypothetical protein
LPAVLVRAFFHELYVPAMAAAAKADEHAKFKKIKGS